jgi:transglutaminase-like putative cysteine protease
MTAFVGCTLAMAVEGAAEIVLQVAAARRPSIEIADRLQVVNNGNSLVSKEVVGAEHSRQQLFLVEPGSLTVSYEGTLTPVQPVSAEPVTDLDRLVALRPSRYCPSDRLAGFAMSHFGELPTAAERVRVICAYVWRHISYDGNASRPDGDAIETLMTGAGVCRDFAHLVVALCRAVDVPARMVAVYAPGLSPMDFHAVAETAIDGHWWVWDATRLAPRPTLVRIATGRDAADVAFLTTISGQVELSTVEMVAIAATDLPLDDHEQLVALG